MPHSTTCNLLLRRCVAPSSSSAASGAGAKRHISCLLPRTSTSARPTRQCFPVVAAARHRPPRAICTSRRYLATIQSGSEFVSAGAVGDADASAAATSTTGADSASAGADSSSFHGMSLRDIDFLVGEFESCSTVEGLAKYLGDPSSLSMAFRWSSTMSLMPVPLDEIARPHESPNELWAIGSICRAWQSRLRRGMHQRCSFLRLHEMPSTPPCVPGRMHLPDLGTAPDEPRRS